MTRQTDPQVLIKLRELWHAVGGARPDSYRDEDDRPNPLYTSDGGIILETNADYPMRLLTPAGTYHVVTKGGHPRHGAGSGVCRIAAPMRHRPRREAPPLFPRAAPTSHLGDRPGLRDRLARRIGRRCRLMSKIISVPRHRRSAGPATLRPRGVRHT